MSCFWALETWAKLTEYGTIKSRSLPLCGVFFSVALVLQLNYWNTTLIWFSVWLACHFTGAVPHAFVLWMCLCQLYFL